DDVSPAEQEPQPHDEFFDGQFNLLQHELDAFDDVVHGVQHKVVELSRQGHEEMGDIVNDRHKHLCHLAGQVLNGIPHVARNAADAVEERKQPFTGVHGQHPICDLNAVKLRFGVACKKAGSVVKTHAENVVLCRIKILWQGW